MKAAEPLDQRLATALSGNAFDQGSWCSGGSAKLERVGPNVTALAGIPVGGTNGRPFVPGW